MCGIIGYKGEQNAKTFISEALDFMKYRGPDSYGMFVKGTESEHLGIGHVRWATTGEISLRNAAPIKKGSITLIHNGHIDNFEDLKRDFSFSGQTDTEVFLSILNNLMYTGIEAALIEAMRYIHGNNAFILLHNDKIYGITNNMPLWYGEFKNDKCLISDPAFIKDWKLNQLENNKVIIL
ncbi:MAG: class II glutamine amidotransferase [Candidatus Thorarchaeota archaeon]